MSSGADQGRRHREALRAAALRPAKAPTCVCDELGLQKAAFPFVKNVAHAKTPQFAARIPGGSRGEPTAARLWRASQLWTAQTA
jgi:hypothetical protein